MNKIHVRTGFIVVPLLVGFSYSALSATIEFEDSQRNVACGEVANLTVTSGKVIAKGTGTCLTVSGPDTPTAAAQNLGTVDTNSQVSKNLTDNAIVKLPLPSASVKIVGHPKLPGARAVATGANAVYYAPSSDDITGSANDSFTYTITDATTKTSASATASVYVNWVKVKSDGCTPAPGIECKGPTPSFPVFFDSYNHILEKSTTHVWSFVYDKAYFGRVGAVLSVGAKLLKISETPGDTEKGNVDCWRDFGESVYYEPVTGVDGYACNLVVGKQYYFNVKNVDTKSTTYQLKGNGG